MQRPDVYVDKSEHCFKDIDIPEPQRRILLESGDLGAMEQTIMELFYRSEFFEEMSNNKQLIDQQVISNHSERLRDMKGI